MKLCLNFGFNSGDSESMFWCATMQQDQLRQVKKQLRLIIIIILLQPSQREREFESRVVCIDGKLCHLII